MRCHWVWATPIPEGIDLAKAGPLLCGGITVFNPLVQFDVRPTDRVGVVGIGGLGHMALQFLNKWGCHVTAFTTSDSKADEAKKMGAHEVVNTRSRDQLKALSGSLNLVLSTVMADLDMNSISLGSGPEGPLSYRRNHSQDSNRRVPPDCAAAVHFRQPVGRAQHRHDHARFLRPA